MIDTCQANTMYSQFYSPNIIATGSSELGENSLSHHSDLDIGVAVIDSFTHFVLEYLEGMNKTSQNTLQELFDSYDADAIYSHPGISTHLSRTPPSELLLTDFFGGVAGVEVEEEEEESGNAVPASADGWNPSHGTTQRPDVAGRVFKKIAVSDTAGGPSTFMANASTTTLGGTSVARGALGAVVLAGAAALTFAVSR